MTSLVPLGGDGLHEALRRAIESPGFPDRATFWNRSVLRVAASLPPPASLRLLACALEDRRELVVEVILEGAAKALASQAPAVREARAFREALAARLGELGPHQAEAERLLGPRLEIVRDE